MNNPSSTIKDTHILLLICLFGLALRLIWVFMSDSPMRFDEPRYWLEVQNLLKSGDFFDGERYAHDMPLTALILAGFIKLTGSGLIGCKIFLSVVSSITIYIIGRLAFVLFPSRTSMLLGGLFAAVYPFFIYYSSLILSETFFVLFVSMYFLFLFREREKQSALLLGIVSGTSHLVRPTLMYFLPVVWLWQVLIMRISWKKATIAIVVFSLFTISWGIRNKSAVGEFIIGNTSLGMVLLDGNNEWNTTGGTTSEIVGYKIFLDDMPEGLSEIQQNRWQKQKALDFIKENPEQFLKLGWNKFLRFWHLWPNYYLYNHGLYKWISLLSFGSILLLSLASLWFLRYEWRKTSIIWLFVCYYTAIHVITVGSIRYRLPLEPLFIALASASIGKIISHWWPRLTSETGG